MKAKAVFWTGWPVTVVVELVAGQGLDSPSLMNIKSVNKERGKEEARNRNRNRCRDMAKKGGYDEKPICSGSLLCPRVPHLICPRDSGVRTKGRAARHGEDPYWVGRTS